MLRVVPYLLAFTFIFLSPSIHAQELNKTSNDRLWEISVTAGPEMIKLKKMYQLDDISGYGFQNTLSYSGGVVISRRVLPRLMAGGGVNISKKILQVLYVNKVWDSGLNMPFTYQTGYLDLQLLLTYLVPFRRFDIFITGGLVSGFRFNDIRYQNVGPIAYNRYLVSAIYGIGLNYYLTDRSKLTARLGHGYYFNEILTGYEHSAQSKHLQIGFKYAL